METRVGGGETQTWPCWWFCLLMVCNPSVFHGSSRTLLVCISFLTSSKSHTRSNFYMAGMTVDLDTTEAVPSSNHFALNICLSVITPLCLWNELIYACLWRLKDPIVFQNALWDPVSPQWQAGSANGGLACSTLQSHQQNPPCTPFAHDPN